MLPRSQRGPSRVRGADDTNENGWRLIPQHGQGVEAETAKSLRHRHAWSMNLAHRATRQSRSNQWQQSWWIRLTQSPKQTESNNNGRNTSIHHDSLFLTHNTGIYMIQYIFPDISPIRIPLGLNSHPKTPENDELSMVETSSVSHHQDIQVAPHQKPRNILLIDVLRDWQRAWLPLSKQINYRIFHEWIAIFCTAEKGRLEGLCKHIQNHQSG